MNKVVITKSNNKIKTTIKSKCLNVCEKIIEVPYE